MKGFGKILILVLVLAIGVAAIYFIASNGGKKVVTPAPSTDPGDPGEKVASADDEDGKPKVSGPQPQIKFEETVYDWGEVYQNKKVVHIFKFKNTGQADLKIDKVKSG